MEITQIAAKKAGTIHLTLAGIAALGKDTVMGVIGHCCIDVLMKDLAHLAQLNHAQAVHKHAKAIVNGVRAHQYAGMALQEQEKIVILPDKKKPKHKIVVEAVAALNQGREHALRLAPGVLGSLGAHAP